MDDVGEKVLLTGTVGWLVEPWDVSFSVFGAGMYLSDWNRFS